MAAAVVAAETPFHDCVRLLDLCDCTLLLRYGSLVAERQLFHLRYPMNVAHRYELHRVLVYVAIRHLHLHVKYGCIGRERRAESAVASELGSAAEL